MPVDKVVRFKSNEAYESVLKICKENDLSIIEEDDLGILIISKKDEWEGVEFVERRSDVWPICKVTTLQVNKVWYRDHRGIEVFLYRNDLKPSTESDYKAQLEKTAIEKFGQIKMTDSFDLTGICPSYSKRHSPQCASKGFEYSKANDKLKFMGLCIYQKGKWATKLPRRIEVEFHSSSIMAHMPIKLTFSVKNWMKNDNENLKHELSKLIEDHLNGEIGKEGSNGN